MNEPHKQATRERHSGADVDVPHRPDDRGSAEPKRRKRRDHPLVIVITGHGKGKSSSAFGMLMRSWARDYRCGVFQFVKSGKWKVGEEKAARALGGIDWEKMGDGWTWLSKDLEETADLAREGWAEVKRAIAEERYEFLLLDELTYPVSWGWIDADDVVQTLRDRLARPVEDEQDVYHSIPCWARMPVSNGCFTLTTSETRSAASTSSGTASRPVITTCWKPGRSRSVWTTSSASIQPQLTG